MESVVEEKTETVSVDREKTCPLLLRVFLNNVRHHSLNEFIRGSVPPNELQIYTWMDATLKELTNLVKEVNPDSRRKGTFFDFALVFPEARGPGYRMREIGRTCSGEKFPDDNKSLLSCRFQIGDYLDIAISPPTYRGGNDGPYRGGNDGPYRGGNDGPYRGGNDGPYRGGNEGPYRGGNDGRRGRPHMY